MCTGVWACVRALVSMRMLPPALKHTQGSARSQPLLTQVAAMLLEVQPEDAMGARHMLCRSAARG